MSQKCGRHICPSTGVLQHVDVRKALLPLSTFVHLTDHPQSLSQTRGWEGLRTYMSSITTYFSPPAVKAGGNPFWNQLRRLTLLILRANYTLLLRLFSLLRLQIRPCLNPVEVDPARHSACIPLYRLVPGLFNTIQPYDLELMTNLAYSNYSPRAIRILCEVCNDQVTA